MEPTLERTAKSGEVQSEAARLRAIRALVRLLDEAFTIPGTRVRVGLDPLLGFLAPGLGDALTALASLVVLHAAYREGAPWPVLLKMAGNVALDFGLGTVPVVGDLADVFLKANRRNLDLLDAHRHGAARPGPGGPSRVLLWLLLAAVSAVILGATALSWALLLGLVRLLGAH